MKKEKGNTKKLLLLGGLAVLLTIGLATYARYSSSASGTGSVDAALYTNDATFTVEDESIPKQPGQAKTIAFSVTNTKEKKTSEVIQTYQFYIETAKNLPLIFELSKDNGANWVTVNGNQITKLTPEPELGLTEETDKWILRITWDASKNSEEYVNELDYVKIKVKMQQKIN